MFTLPGERRILLPLYLSALGTWSAYALIVVVLPFRFQALGLSVVEYGVALAVYALGTLVTEGLWGYLAFRIGSSRYLGGIAVLTVVSMVAIGFARSFVELCVVLGIYGMLVVYSTPLIRWIAMTSSGGGGMSRGLGLLGLFFGIGLTVGTATGPLLYSFGGFWLNIGAGTAVFALSTVPLLLVPWRAVSLPRATGSGGGSLRALLNRGFVLATGFVVLYFMSYTLVTSFLQYYSIGVFHGSLDQAGFVIGAARGTALVSGVVLGAVVDRRGPSRAAPVGFLLLCAGAVGTWISPNYGAMVLATVVLAVGAGTLSVTLLPMALSSVVREHQGTAVGVFGSFEDLGLVLGPVLIGGVYGAFGPRDAFLTVAGIALGAALATLAVRARSRTQGPGKKWPAPGSRGTGGALPIK